MTRAFVPSAGSSSTRARRREEYSALPSPHPPTYFLAIPAPSMSPSLSFPSTRARCPPWSSARVASPRVPETPPPQSRAPSSSPRSRTRPCVPSAPGRTPAPWRRLHRRHRRAARERRRPRPARGVVVVQHVRREHHVEPIGGPIVRDVVPVERLDVREGRVLRDVLRDASSRELEDVRVEVHHENLRGAGFRGGVADESEPGANLEDALSGDEGRTVGDEAREGDGGGPHDVTRAVERVAETLEVFTRDAIAGDVGDVRGDVQRDGLPWPRSTVRRTAEEASPLPSPSPPFTSSAKTRSRWRSRRDFFLFLRARASSGGARGCRRANLGGGARDERRGASFRRRAGDDARGRGGRAERARMHRPSPSRREHRRAGGEGDVAMHSLMDELELHHVDREVGGFLIRESRQIFSTVICYPMGDSHTQPESSRDHLHFFQTTFHALCARVELGTPGNSSTASDFGTPRRAASWQK